MDLSSIWDIATHISELIAAHGLMEAGKQPIKHGAAKAVAWLHQHLNEADRPKVAAVAQNPDSKSAQAALAVSLNALLEADPALVPHLRALLAEIEAEGESMNQTVGDNNKGVFQVRGSGNTFTVS